MTEEEKSNILVSVSDDKMQGLLFIRTQLSPAGEKLDYRFTEDELLGVLREKGVKEGIDKQLLSSVIKNKTYDRYVIIATGKPAVNGTDGYYKFYFKNEINTKPKVLEDGSVDYHATENYEPVDAGALVAEYIKAESGRFGYTVTAEAIPWTAGKELSPLQGKGFTLSEDKTKYYSELSGKIEFSNGILSISNVLELEKDVDLTTGDINFGGDVLIKGNVVTGAVINATGNVTVLGNVEGARISAGGDINIKSGMQGGGKGRIECGGDLWGKFFENVVIKAKHDLHTNSLLNCDTECYGNLYVSGKHGIIVGGLTKCHGNIEATMIGNPAEMKTLLTVGVSDENMNALKEIKASIQDNKNNTNKLEQAGKRLELIKNSADEGKLNAMKKQVADSLSQLSAQLIALQASLSAKLAEISASSSSKIYVLKYLYPHVRININGIYYEVKDTYTNVTVKEHNSEVEIINNP